MPADLIQDQSPVMAISAALHLRVAKPDDHAGVFQMVAALNAEDGHPVGRHSRAALRLLLESPDLGRVFMLEQACRSDDPIGYIIVCFGYSVELGGRDLLIDEIYLHPEHRGKGYGGAILRAIEDWACAEGFASAFLEVMHGNRAEALYRRMGYAERNSTYLGKSLLPDG